ncbi:MAG TPA: hypothetical protein VHP34_08480 [Alphaproteobacteria bacterium]|jgi:hypothetical protein|nr:hypothetical protein [Alphaproteobacteria bacterium]
MYRGPSLRTSFGNRGMRTPLLFKIVPAVILAGALGTGGMAVHYQTAEPTTQRVTVTDKDRHVSSEGGGTYIVFTDKEVFENTDSMLRGKINSSDVQAQLHVGCTYDITAYGFRNNWFSIYRNISAAEHVKTETCPVNKPPVRGM